MTQFDDPDAPPSEEEIRESQRLRDALEDASKPSEDADPSDGGEEIPL